jgi:hypothetical protein
LLTHPQLFPLDFIGVPRRKQTGFLCHSVYFCWRLICTRSCLRSLINDARQGFCPSCSSHRRFRNSNSFLFDALNPTLFNNFLNMYNEISGGGEFIPRMEELARLVYPRSASWTFTSNPILNNSILSTNVKHAAKNHNSGKLRTPKCPLFRSMLSVTSTRASGIGDCRLVVGCTVTHP